MSTIKDKSFHEVHTETKSSNCQGNEISQSMYSLHFGE